MMSIADVAVRKRHQRHDEILIFITLTILESAKLFSLSNVCISNQRMLCETCAFIANAQALAVGTGLRYVLRVYIAWRTFLKTTFG